MSFACGFAAFDGYGHVTRSVYLSDVISNYMDSLTPSCILSIVYSFPQYLLINYLFISDLCLSYYSMFEYLP
jgi:hypothetical protein